MKKIIFLSFIFLKSLLCKAQLPSYLPSNGLLGWWPFNSNANDESGNGKNGNPLNVILAPDRFGVPNSAYMFNGINSKIVTALNSTNSNPVSISCWINTSVSQANEIGIVVARTGPGNSNGLYIFNNIQYLMSISECGQSFHYAAYQIPKVNDGKWHHYVGTYNGNMMKVYIDGILRVSQPLTVPICINSKFIFGHDDAFPGRFFNGLLDDIGIWNRELLQSEIDQLYQACAPFITGNPINQTVDVGKNAVFIVTSADTNSTYQWQTDLGVGFQNLNNVSQYSGVKDDTLKISNLSMLNDNQAFRCIVNSGGCSEISTPCTLYVNPPLSVKTLTGSSFFKAQQTSSNTILLRISPEISNGSYIIYNAIGKEILKNPVFSEITDINTESLSPGIYFFEMRSQKEVRIGIQKLIIQ